MKKLSSIILSPAFIISLAFILVLSSSLHYIPSLSLSCKSWYDSTCTANSRLPRTAAQNTVHVRPGAHVIRASSRRALIT
ncbi:hypothetical protein V8C40DRAFT_232016 [Trichoderma camerunense]